jgi:hypothetical protein
MEGMYSEDTAMPTKIEVEQISFVGDQDAEILARLGHQQQLEVNEDFESRTRIIV